MIKEENILNARILIVDDEETSVRLLLNILEKAGYIHIKHTCDPREASKLYFEYKPDVLVLDLYMPEVDGFAVLKELNNNSVEDFLPVLIISSEGDMDKRVQALESGGRDFLLKPYSKVEVLCRIRNIIEVHLLHTQIQTQNKILEEKVSERTQQLYNTQIDVISRLARAIEYRDSETGMHVVRMSRYAVCLAEESHVPAEVCSTLMNASPLHDIGKIGIPDSILLKPGKLSPEEWEIMKTHTTIGAELLTGIDSTFLAMAKIIALTHHEKWDGSGYPQGLSNDSIPILGRICGISDVFDALTSKRPYKNAWSADDAFDEINKCSGSHFDPELAANFIKIRPKIEEIKNKYEDPQI